MIKQPEKYQDFQDPQAHPRYTGIATFFRTPASQRIQDVDIGLIGVPFDGGVTHRSGTRHGPRAVREQSTMLRRLNGVTRVMPFARARVRDLGDCWIEQPYEIQGALREIEAFYRTVTAAVIVPLSVGGDHSISLPILRAVAARGPVGMIHIDAHCDTGDDYMGSRFHHGAPFRRAVEEGLLDPHRVIQIGIRGTTNDPDMWGFSQSSGMRVLPMEEFDDKGWRFAAEEARRIAGDGPTYLTFDIDSLDPSQAPGTGTPEAGGI
ncbi:MAG TPA: agmatinase, partial [Rhodopila sp.]